MALDGSNEPFGGPKLIDQTLCMSVSGDNLMDRYLVHHSSEGSEGIFATNSIKEIQKTQKWKRSCLIFLNFP